MGTADGSALGLTEGTSEGLFVGKSVDSPLVSVPS